jgi:hypothetical protein
MKLASLIVAVISLFTGLASAWYWLKSSKVEVDPKWAVQPGEFEAVQMGWTAALLSAGLEAAKLNKWAAIYAGLSIGAGTIANFLSAAS